MELDFNEYSEENFLSKDKLKFVDLSNNFRVNGYQNDLEVLYDAESVKQSIVNLIFTQKGSMNILMNVGSSLMNYLGMPISENTAYAIGEEITRTLKANETRIDNIKVNMLLIDRGYEAYIVYDVPGLKRYNETISVNILTNQ